MKEEDKFKKMFEYSLGIVFISFSTFWGTSRYVSLKYLQSDQKTALSLLFFLLLCGSLFLLLNVLANGLSLVSLFANYEVVIRNFSERFFECGIGVVFLGFITYLPFFLSLLFRFFLPWFIYFLLTIIVAFLILKRLISERSFIQKIKYESLFFILFLAISLISWFGTCFVYSNSYTIVMEEEYFEKENEQYFLITISVTGFASIEDPEEACVRISSGDTWEELDLHELEEDFFYAYVNLNELKEGAYFVEFRSQNPRGPSFVEYLVISNLKKEECSHVLSFCSLIVL